MMTTLGGVAPKTADGGLADQPADRQQRREDGDGES